MMARCDEQRQKACISTYAHVRSRPLADLQVLENVWAELPFAYTGVSRHLPTKLCRS
jgi:hypothetical protein